MKRIVGGLVAGALLLGGVALGQGGVQLPPAKDEIAAMETAFAQVTRFFAELITEVKDAVAALNAVDVDLASKYRAVAARLGEAEAKIRELQEVCANVPALATRVDGLAGRLEEAWRQIAELRATAESLKKTDQDLALGLTNLTQALEQMRRDFSSAVATLGEKVSDLSKQILVVEARLSSLEAYDIRLTDRLTALGDKVTALEAYDKELTGKLNSLGDTVAGIGRQVADHAGRLAVLEAQDIGSIQRRVIALEQAIQALNIKIENNREKIGALEKAIGGFTADLKTSIGALVTRVDELEAKMVTVEEKIGTDLKAVQDALAMAQGLAIVALLAAIAAIVVGFMR